ncbi:TIGR03032 family protein [Burkholderia sp. FERM BP-3421]|uniref:TIGR03032 family protein n=1 Tax=Burkholderia sp. FERM BP-3421 TaxID=1494466 RepID=UPI00235F41D4|nr:TIGR03032 family protein [Burkholderia sp. FERM BP-3421]WDD91352.1 TIGR03032 family protein [Burkholderia sp. FERM BP-3421]
MELIQEREAASIDADDHAPLLNVQETGRFVALLEALQCTLALSRRPTGVALLGVEQGAPTLSACLLPRSMGLAVAPDRLAIATQKELMVFANVRGIAGSYPPRPDYYDAIYAPRTMHFTGYCDLHDMAFNQQTMVAVNTAYSCLCAIDGHFNFTPIWQPPFISSFGPGDRCHLNGMAFHDGKVHYATALGATDEPGAWRAGMASGGIVMEVPSGRIVASGMSMPHSPRVIDGRLFVLEGGRGQVLTIDPATGAKTVVAKLPGFTHGLAEYRGVLFVGLSKLRMRRGPQGLPIEQDGELVAGVAALDVRNGEVLGTLQFHNGISEVFDVQVIPGVRRAEILSPMEWMRTTSVVTMQGGMWDLDDADDENGEAHAA